MANYMRRNARWLSRPTWLITILLINTQAFACDMPIGKYELFTESHWGVELEVVDKKSFTVTWSAYLAGQPETLETKTYKGQWSCKDNIYSFTYELETVTAEYKKSPYYPLGIYKDKKAIVFSGKPQRNKFLSGYVFWQNSRS